MGHPGNVICHETGDRRHETRDMRHETCREYGAELPQRHAVVSDVVRVSAHYLREITAYPAVRHGDLVRDITFTAIVYCNQTTL